MAYLRGDTYIWSDGERLHLWDAHGDDGWRDTIWYQEAPPGEESRQDRDAGEGANGASGVALQYEQIDQFVVMRLAELLEQGRLADVVDETVEAHGGNGGCQALTRQRERLLRALR